MEGYFQNTTALIPNDVIDIYENSRIGTSFRLADWFLEMRNMVTLDNSDPF